MQRNEHLSTDFNDEKSISSEQRRKQKIENYVTNILTKHQQDGTSPTIEIDINSSRSANNYENVSAFRKYRISNESIDLSDSLAELNFDPDPIIEQKESAEQKYQQKVYIRQLQPPTPQPVEIQVQEVLIKPQRERSPIHVRLTSNQPRTPSPIIIKSAPPAPPSQDNDRPIVYNKYIPPPPPPPRQIIIHRYPELPPKPRPIVVEQWLPYKPAPRKVIKRPLPPEALQPPSAPHNIIVSYAKPRAVIEVELVRLPVVKVDPQTYQQMTADGTQQSLFQQESNHSRDADQMKWRI